MSENAEQIGSGISETERTAVTSFPEFAYRGRNAGQSKSYRRIYGIAAEKALVSARKVRDPYLPEASIFSDALVIWYDQLMPFRLLGDA